MSECKTCEINEKKDLVTPFLYSLIFLGIFGLIQKFSLAQLLNSKDISLPFVFFIGIIASISTCAASVGGLVLSLSSFYSQTDKNPTAPLLKFHISRLVTFFVLGGIIGYLGSILTISLTLNLILNTAMFIIMLFLGLNLLGILKKSLKINLKFIKTDKLYLTPSVLGFITFFMPCGFTQSMQFYSLSLGTFWSGAINMLVFAIGTLPALALTSYLSIKFSESSKKELFFRTSGFIVIYFALLNLYLSLKYFL